MSTNCSAPHWFFHELLEKGVERASLSSQGLSLMECRRPGPYQAMLPSSSSASAVFCSIMVILVCVPEKCDAMRARELDAGTQVESMMAVWDEQLYVREVRLYIHKRELKRA